jgi:hypothetical protein
MSSTERKGDALDDATRARALAFFRDKIVPAAEKLRARGVRFFPLGPDAEEGSWFVPYSAATDEEIDAEGPSAGRLEVLWAEHPELAELARPLFALAEEIHRAATEESELSPCMYVMF